jgi:hypothetical protein
MKAPAHCWAKEQGPAAEAAQRHGQCARPVRAVRRVRGAGASNGRSSLRSRASADQAAGANRETWEILRFRSTRAG